jgi:hypothetical protein
MPLVISRLTAGLALLATFLVPTVALASSREVCVMKERGCASVRGLGDCCCHSLGGSNAPATPATDPSVQPTVATPLESIIAASVPGIDSGAPHCLVIPPAPPRAGLFDLSTLFSTLLI